jgi:Spy/CpxP family protein refolding chaperone
MKRVFFAATLFATMVFLSGSVTGQDKKDKAKQPQLPAGWKALGLSDEQKSKVYAIQGEYREKMAALQRQLDEMKKEQTEKMLNVLTDEQRKQLREAALKKVDPKGSDKKPTDKKPTDKKPDATKDKSKDSKDN